MSSRATKNALPAQVSPGSDSRVNLTPVTQLRSGIQFAASPLASPMLSHLVNDDTSEKRKRLKARLSDRVQKHLSSPASESRNKSLNANLAGWNAAQISDHLHNCIQMSRENKINVKNAFSLHLIDTLKAVIHKEKETNFQMAGSSLEAGAKIYSHRVDALHLQAIQVHDQVSQIDRSGDAAKAGSVEDEQIGEQEAGQAGRKKTARKKKIIETDEKKLTIPNVEQMAEIDPLLQKLSKEGDSSFGGLLLSALRCADDDGTLMLNMSCNPEPSSQIRLHEAPITQFELPDVSVEAKVLCPTFHQFAFNKSSQHPIFTLLSTHDEGLTYDPDKEVSINEPAADDFPMADDDDCGSDGGDGGAGADGGQLFTDYATQSNPQITTTVSKLTDGTLDSLLSLVSNQAGDYSFFRNMKNMWAGPAHWKSRAKRAGEGSVSVKRKAAAEKTQFTLDFDAEADFTKKFKKTKAATTVSKSTLERYKKQTLTLPEDLHYDSKDLLKIFTRPQVLTLHRNDGDGEPVSTDDNMSSGNDYDYDNKNDTANFCPNISGDVDDNDDMQYSVASGSQHPTALDFDDTLVNQPQLVEKINLNYAKRPKKVDFKRLKKNMWNLITTPDVEKENAGAETAEPPPAQQREVQNGTSFHQVYDKLPQLCPSHEAKDLSVPIAFVALLHMCNEKNLQLTSQKAFRDLLICAGDA